MSYNLIEITLVLIGLTIAALLTVFLNILNLLFSPFVPSSEKRSPYECGFYPFDDARVNFKVHFFIVGLLFLIFDLEVLFLLPWVGSFSYLNLLPFFIVYLFLFIVVAGFVYELAKGALRWRSSTTSGYGVYHYRYFPNFPPTF
jgi:NADH-quinone oxidoreductase subunit A